MSRISLVALFCFSLILIAGCGGGSSSNAGGNTVATAAANVATISINGGPNGNLPNGLFTTITVCSPGSTTNCVTIPDVMIDTGSTGVRLINDAVQAISPGFTLPAQLDPAGNGNTIGECALFADGFSWGSMATADVTISGEKASSMPVHIINENFSTVPSSCSSTGGSEEDTVATFGANGIIGLNNAPQDCGSACTASGAANPGIYFSCPASGAACTTALEAVTSQVQNMATFFPTDNNGVIIELGQISTGGAASATGALVFGIGTESNNGLGSAVVLTTDDFGDFTTSFQGNSIAQSFTDSGTTVLAFPDSSLTTCDVGSFGEAFCPGSTVSLTATNQGVTGTNNTTFAVANANTLLSTNDEAFNDLAVPEITAPNGQTLGFDWGVPFFYGRNVFVAVDGATTPAGAGPYIAY